MRGMSRAALLPRLPAPGGQEPRRARGAARADVSVGERAGERAGSWALAAELLQREPVLIPSLHCSWNKGTEDKADFKYHNGNDEPQGASAPFSASSPSSAHLAPPQASATSPSPSTTSRRPRSASTTWASSSRSAPRTARCATLPSSLTRVSESRVLVRIAALTKNGRCADNYWM